MVVAARREGATIVLVEDDPAVARMIADALDSSGYEVRHATTGSEAMALVRRTRPDLIVLDLMLPDIDGLVLCSALKQMAPTPIVICSATPQKRDAVVALKLGADDFIAKPFDVDELEARLEAVLRRLRPLPPAEPPRQASDRMRVGNLTIDRARRSVLVGAEPLALTPTEHRLIATLVDRADEVITRSELARKVWGYEDESSGRAIDV